MHASGVSAVPTSHISTFILRDWHLNTNQKHLKSDLCLVTSLYQMDVDLSWCFQILLIFVFWFFGREFIIFLLYYTHLIHTHTYICYTSYMIWFFKTNALVSYIYIYIKWVYYKRSTLKPLLCYWCHQMCLNGREMFMVVTSKLFSLIPLSMSKTRMHEVEKMDWLWCFNR